MSVTQARVTCSIVLSVIHFSMLVHFFIAICPLLIQHCCSVNQTSLLDALLLINVGLKFVSNEIFQVSNCVAAQVCHSFLR